jgi:hypothetical protein
VIGFAWVIAQSETTTTVVGAAARTASLSYRPILWFGGLALAFVGGVQLIRSFRGESFSVTFARLYGLIMLATLASVLVFADVDSSAKTGAFTLLGTIAGYLAGARPTGGGGAVDDDGDGDGGDDGGEGPARAPRAAGATRSPASKDRGGAARPRRRAASEQVL